MKEKNRVAVVTGGGRGVGNAIARTLARDGFDLILCGRTATDLAVAVDEIRAQYAVSAGYYVVDVSKSEEVERFFFSSVLTEFAAIDVLVNNVGRAQRFGGFSTLQDQDWQDAWNTNFMSAVYMTRGALPWLKLSKAARIVNISSVPARQPGFFNPHYSAAKAALVNLSKYLSNSLAEDHILVNTICPGTLKGGGWDRNVADRSRRDGILESEAAERMEAEEIKKVPLRKIGKPEDVAELVAFLASERSQFITGTCIDVDGGVTRSIF